MLVRFTPYDRLLDATLYWLQYIEMDKFLKVLNLTPNKIYLTITLELEIEKDHYIIENDGGIVLPYPFKFFTIISEERDSKINELLK